MTNDKLDIKTLEYWLWEAVCKIRGEIDAPKYKDYILPLIFLKRLSDVFDDEMIKLSKKYLRRETAEQLMKKDHSLVRFCVPKEARWKTLAYKQRMLVSIQLMLCVASLERTLNFRVSLV